MKKIVFLLMITAFIGLSWNAEAQKERKSPAAKAEGKIGEANVVIDYFQPSARGRKIMGGLVPYGQVWRTGANNATVFTIDRDVKVQGETLPAGKYALFTIPDKDEWTIIFNSKHDQWGAFNYNEDDDVLRVKATPRQVSDMIEAFTIDVVGDGVEMGWENTKVKFDVED